MYYLSDVIIDLLFHALVMFYLITGVSNGYKLKKMPEDEPLPEFGEINPNAEASAEAEDHAKTEMPAFDESLFEITEEKATPDEPVTARTFDEIMSENNKNG